MPCNATIQLTEVAQSWAYCIGDPAKAATVGSTPSPDRMMDCFLVLQGQHLCRLVKHLLLVVVSLYCSFNFMYSLLYEPAMSTTKLPLVGELKFFLIWSWIWFVFMCTATFWPQCTLNLKIPYPLFDKKSKMEVVQCNTRIQQRGLTLQASTVGARLI